MNRVVIRGGTLVFEDRIIESDILIEGEQIKSIQKEIRVENAQEIDARGKLVLPGGVDVHVHLPWPSGSNTSSDDFFSGTRAAAYGGVTTIIDYVIPKEDESLREALKRKQDTGQTNAWVDYSFHINLRGDLSNRIDDIQGLVKDGFPSFKIFLAYEIGRASCRERG